MAGVCDAEGNWISTATRLASLDTPSTPPSYRKTILVQTGDVVDRGPDAKRIYELLISLKKQAADVKDEVIPLLGNHEIMNLLQVLNFVTGKDIDNFGGPAKRKKELSSTG